MLSDCLLGGDETRGGVPYMMRPSTQLIKQKRINMEDEWKGTDYTICPTCKEVVRMEDLVSGVHDCRYHERFVPRKIEIWD